MHASGVHATVAGVLLGFAVPVVRRATGPGPGLAEHLEHRFRPLSAGLAVPVFAFFASGVSLPTPADSGQPGEPDHDRDRVVAGLVIGKTVGILGSTYLVSPVHPGRAGREISWRDLLGVALLGGVGFTVSLLIGELAFGTGSTADEHVKTAVLAGSVLAALLALRSCGSRYRRFRAICAEGGDGRPRQHTRPGPGPQLTDCALEVSSSNPHCDQRADCQMQ